MKALFAAFTAFSILSSTVAAQEFKTPVLSKLLDAVRNNQFKAAGTEGFIEQYDLDGDGKILGSDVIKIRNYASSSIEQRNLIFVEIDQLFKTRTSRVGTPKFLEELDLNLDGRINNKDRKIMQNELGVAIQRDILKRLTNSVIEHYGSNNGNCDLNGDGAVNVADAVMVSQFTQQTTRIKRKVREKMMAAVEALTFKNPGDEGYSEGFNLNDNPMIESSDVILVREYLK